MSENDSWPSVGSVLAAVETKASGSDSTCPPPDLWQYQLERLCRRVHKPTEDRTELIEHTMDVSC